jgi:hypothetical protein
MSFEQIPEILKNLVTENLTDPEQQRRLIKTVAGFVTRPDLSDADSGYTFGRLQEINRSNREKEAAKAAAAKAKVEENKELRKRLYELELKKVESAYRIDEIRERARLQKEGKGKPDNKFMQNLFKGDVPLSLAVTENNGIYTPTSSFLMEMANYGPTQEFAKMNIAQLKLSSRFQNFAKSLFEKQSSKRANEEKTNPRLGGNFVKLGEQVGAITPESATVVAEQLKKGTPTQVIVAKHFPRYLKNASSIFKFIFSNKTPDENTLKSMYDPSVYSLDQMRNNFNGVRNTYNSAMEEISRKGIQADNDSLKQLGKNLADIIDYMGESENFKSALRAGLAPKTIYGDEKGVSSIPNPDSKIATVTEIDARFITRNAGLRAIATHLGILNSDHVPPITEDVQTTATNKETGHETVVFGQSGKADVAGLINNIESRGKKNLVIDRVRMDAIKELRANQFDRETLKATSMKLYDTFIAQGESNTNAFEIVTYLASQQIKQKGTHYQPNGLIRQTVYKAIGKNREAEKDKKWFDEYAKTSSSMGELLEQADNILSLAELKPDTFGGGLLLKGGTSIKPKFGGVSDLKQKFNNFVGFLRDAKQTLFAGQNTNSIGLVGDRAKLAMEQFAGSVGGNRLSENSRIFLGATADKANELQKKIDDEYLGSNKLGKDYLEYMRKTVILWEKTALTYKLAGIVQGDSTGGRTISDADFQIIYNNLWGDTVAPELASAASLTHLRQVTNLSLKRRRAEVILAQATGGMFSDSQYNDISTSIYRREMDKFYFNHPKAAKLRDEATGANRENVINDAANSFINFYDEAKNIQFRYKGERISLPNFSKNQIKKFYDVSNQLRVYMSLGRDEKLTEQNRAIIADSLKFATETEDFGRFVDTIELIDRHKDAILSIDTFKDIFRPGFLNTFGTLPKNIQDIMTNRLEYMDAYGKATSEEERQKIDQRYFTSDLPKG